MMQKITTRLLKVQFKINNGETYINRKDSRLYIITAVKTAVQKYLVRSSI
jgi:hypothetical protein